MNQKTSRIRHHYLLINFVLTGGIILLFLYFALFDAAKDNYPVPSFYEKITGTPSPSEGLSRSLSEIIRGNFDSARDYSESGMAVFIFFCLQLFQRLLATLVIFRGWIRMNRLLLADIILSAGLLVYFFRGFLMVLF